MIAYDSPVPQKPARRELSAEMASADLDTLNARRLQQMLALIALILVLVALVNWSQGRAHAAWIELATTALLLLPYWRNRSGRTSSATAWLISILLAALLPLMLGGRGLYGAAPVAYAGMLLLVGLYGSMRLLVGTLIAIFGSLGAAYLMPPAATAVSVPSLTLPSLIITYLLVAAIAVLVWVSAHDRSSAVQRLQQQTHSLLATKTAMEALAFQDALTQLPNRVWAEQVLQHALESAGEQRQVAMVLFDLDNFRVVNESLGYPAGDALLRQIALRLQSEQPSLRGLARFSSDEFIVVLEQVRDAAQVSAIAERIRQLLEHPFTIEGIDIMLTTSLGLAMAPRDGRDAEVLIKSAELALRRAKERGRDCLQWFEPGLRHHVGEHLRLASSLRTALAEGQLQLHYQPKIDLMSGRVVGAEALLRWQHPERGWIEPTEFIPVAESTGLISALGGWVLDRACQDLCTWREAGLAEVGVAVNVSPVQFRRERIEQAVQQMLERYRLPRGVLELELTEAVFVGDVQSLHEVLARVVGLGVRLAIDDFGTGYSNLGYLQHYPVHCLKIDQSFVRRMCTSRHDDGIVRAVIAMAHSLDLQVIAEGVEDEQTRARLWGYGCDQGQGFYWAPALPLQQFIAYAHKRAQAPAAQTPEALRAASSAR